MDTADRWVLLYVSSRNDPGRAAAEAADGLAVRTASTVEEARERFDREVDCVTCVHGDELDGLALLSWVRDERPGCPFVLVADDASVATRAVARDVSEFVASEAGIDALLDRTAAALARTPDRAGPGGIDGLATAAELRLKERAMDKAPVGITVSDPDRPDNPLVYVNDRFEALTGYSPTEMQGRNCRVLQGPETDPRPVAEMREAIDEERPTSVELLNYRKDGTPFWNEVTIAPLRDEAGRVTNFVGFQSDVTDRKEAERALEAERAALARLLDRLDGLLQEVTRDLVDAGSRTAVEQAVADRLAALETYQFAWVGSHDRVEDALVQAAVAGDSAFDDLTVDLDADSPLARAYRTATAQVVRGESARATLPAGADLDVRGAVAVPLSYGGTVYGVVGLWTTDAAALTDHEVAVFEALGRIAATAVNAIERGYIIGTDAVVELEVFVTDRDLFAVALATESGCRMEYEGAVVLEDGTVGLFFSTAAPTAVVESVVADRSDVASVTCIRSGDESLYEFDVPEDSLVSLLAGRGVGIRDLRVDTDGARVRLELPTEADAREVFELVESRYPGSELLRYRERERPPGTRSEFVDDLRDRLTDRQRTALHLAFVGGYYAPDRRVTGDELAAAMDVTRSTFHQHLRAAERKLVEGVLDAEPFSDEPDGRDRIPDQ